MVIALLEAQDPLWVNAAARRGIFAYIVDGNPAEMQSAIDITIRRYGRVRAQRSRRADEFSRKRERFRCCR